MDLSFIVIASLVFEEIDLTYEGIATIVIFFVNLRLFIKKKLTLLTKGLRHYYYVRHFVFYCLYEEIDLTYEGIATSARVLLITILPL